MSAVEKAQWLEFQTLLPGYLLSTQGDRMALAHGVENRCPFLDKAVVDLASSVNLRFDDGFEEKRLLRNAFKDCLPPSIQKRRKFPYRAPDSAAFASIRPDYLDLVCSDAGACQAALSRRAFCPRAGQEGDDATGDRDQHEGKPDVRVPHVAGLPAPHVRDPRGDAREDA